LVLVATGVSFGGGAEEFRNPRLVEVKAPGGDLTVRARRGTAFVPGLGEVDEIYAYEVRRGTSFPAKASRSVELMPPVISIERGSTLRIAYRNELLAADAGGRKQPTESNLHTHGLLVSPQGVGGSFGDCIFVTASTRGSGAPRHSAGDPCSLDPAASHMRTEDGDIHYSYVIAPDHPSGTYWFHPHPHGLSEGQVWNGLAGLMTIGSLWDTAYVKCGITASPNVVGLGACRDQEAQREELEAERRSTLEVRYLAFKDLQVSKSESGSRFRLIEFPLRPAADDRAAEAAFAEQTDARKGRCGKLEVSGTGDLTYVDGVAVPGQCWQKEHPDQRWIFTVSGQLRPRITVKPGGVEVWRLANISADVTYRLRLETVEEKPRRLAFELRALDGAAFRPDRIDRRHTEVVLMPGARVEVLLRRCAAGDTDCVDPSRRTEARLRTAGMATGIDDDSGDQWPPIDLASVVFEPTPGAASIQGQASPAVERAAPMATPARPPAGTRSACDYARYQAGPADLSLDSNLVRLIRFNNRDFGEHGGELFGIHVENFRMLDQAGSAVAVADLVDEGRVQSGAKPAAKIASISLDDPCWTAATSEEAEAAKFARFYPAFRMDAPPDLTAAYGAREYWLLVNDSDECHNFHIHQTKFLVLDADFSASGGAARCLGDRGVAPPVNRNVLHDTYPLPPRARVLVELRFDGPKLGRFVFHCHILEHEDKGMMATIGVMAR
jgi:FtsP/CotA-like multicopper oxidase with cupredoxin domain